MKASPPRAVLGAVCLGLLAACSEPEAAVERPRPLVLVSVPPLENLVERLAGDLVRVVVVIPPEENPLQWEPGIDQLAAADSASLYVEVGHPSFVWEQAWRAALLDESPGLPVVDASAGTDTSGPDPHIWLSPWHLGPMAEQVAGALTRLLPDEAGTIEDRLDTLIGEISALDAELDETLKPVRGSAFLVVHPAWGAFAEEYGLEQIAIEPDGKAPDSRALADLIARTREKQVRIVFVQPQFDASPAEQIAEEIGARVEVGDPLAPDWEASLRRVASALAEDGRAAAEAP